MRPFPLLRIPAHLLERVLPKLKEKEYFRMQQTCKDVEQFIRTNRRINVHVRRNCPMAMPRRIITRRLSTCINPKLATVEDIYGARFKRIRLPPNIPDFSAFCQYLKTHRISANELRLYARCHRGFTKENCLDLFKVMKPIKVILNSLDSDRFESLFQHKQLESVQLVVDYDRVLNVVEKLGPHLRELKIISKGGQSEIMDLVLSVIRVFERISRPESFKVFKFCAKWDAAPVPTLEKMFQMFRNYSPRAVEQPDAAKDKKKILCNLSDNDTFFKVRMDETTIVVHLR